MLSCGIEPAGEDPGKAKAPSVAGGAWGMMIAASLQPRVAPGPPMRVVVVAAVRTAACLRMRGDLGGDGGGVNQAAIRGLI